jgi:sulfopyruvate decarboxylase TPP-binding subunit
MIESDVFVQALEDVGFDFFTGLPDSLFGGILSALMARRLFTPAVREDEAVAMAAGAYLAGRIPAVLMPSAGLGRSLETLVSLNQRYRQPCLLLVAWHGTGETEGTEPRAGGAVGAAMLTQARIPHRTLSEAGAPADLNWMATTFMKERVPVALLLPGGVVRGIQP